MSKIGEVFDLIKNWGNIVNGFSQGQENGHTFGLTKKMRHFRLFVSECETCRSLLVFQTSPRFAVSGTALIMTCAKRRDINKTIDELNNHLKEVFSADGKNDHGLVLH